MLRKPILFLIACSTLSLAGTRILAKDLQIDNPGPFDIAAGKAVKLNIKHSMDAEKTVLFASAKISLDIYANIKSSYCNKRQILYEVLFDKYSQFVEINGLLDRLISLNLGLAKGEAQLSTKTSAYSRAAEQIEFVIKGRLSVANRALEVGCLSIAQDQYSKIIMQYPSNFVSGYQQEITSKQDILRLKISK